MRPNRLKDLAADPNLISGIYNYCDRWCERCAFTSRCLLYATEQADPDAHDPELRDITNEKFWRKMHEMFAETSAMISEWAAESRVDLESIDVSQEMADHERTMEAARNDVLSQDATKYAATVQRWFADEFATQRDVHSDTRDTQGSDETDINISDAAEVVRWYQFFIAVKLMRALSGASETTEGYLDDEDGCSFDFNASDDDDQFDYDDVIARSSAIDANGSAKTALIAIDRSIAGWRALQISLAEKSETIKPLLIQLDHLRRSTESRFARARGFMRPGFDEHLSHFAN
jgi:hypothetical protein